MRSILVLAAIVLMACGNGERPSSTPTTNTLAKPTARLLILTDLQGQLEPCGCQSRPLGGLDRVATEIQRSRADGVPTLALVAGDLFFGGDSHDTDNAASAQQDAWRAETVVEIFNRFGVAALNPGASDWHHVATELDPLLAKLSAPLLGARVPGPTPVVRMLDAGGIKIGTIGFYIDTSVAADPDFAPIAHAAQQLRSQGAAVVVALLSGDRRYATQITRKAGVDFTINGGVDASEPAPPVQVGAGFVLNAGRHGETILVLDLYRSGEGPFVDASPWTRERSQRALDLSIQELRAKIKQWEADPHVDASAVAQQKARLAELEQTRGSTNGSVSGNRFVAVSREIGPEIARDPAVDALINAYDQRVNDHNRVAFADVAAPAPAPGQPRYVGSAQCQSCHQKAFAWWTEHPHGRAYATLQEAHKEFNLSCVGCHVTGYNQPGGSTVVQNQGLTNVGCESCHGPGSAHADDPDEEPYSVQRVVPANVCVTCHNAEHSDKFDYDKYRAKLLVPGHGHGQPAIAAPTGTL